MDLSQQTQVDQEPAISAKSPVATPIVASETIAPTLSNKPSSSSSSSSSSSISPPQAPTSPPPPPQPCQCPRCLLARDPHLAEAFSEAIRQNRSGGVQIFHAASHLAAAGDGSSSSTSNVQQRQQKPRDSLAKQLGAKAVYFHMCVRRMDSAMQRLHLASGDDGEYEAGSEEMIVGGEGEAEEGEEEVKNVTTAMSANKPSPRPPPGAVLIVKLKYIRPSKPPDAPSGKRKASAIADELEPPATATKRHRRVHSTEADSDCLRCGKTPGRIVVAHRVESGGWLCEDCGGQQAKRRKRGSKDVSGELSSSISELEKSRSIT